MVGGGAGEKRFQFCFMVENKLKLVISALQAQCLQADVNEEFLVNEEGHLCGTKFVNLTSNYKFSFGFLVQCVP